MKISVRIFLITIAGCILFNSAWAQKQYTSYKSMMQNIDALTKEYPALCSVKSLARSAGNNEIMVLAIGTGDRDNKPGIAVLGGIEGSHILGKELAFGFASSLLKESGSPEIKSLLEKITFYVFPDVSPDATEQFFRDLKYERNINARSTDEDRDFTFDEDPYEDLDKNGFITMIRVTDPAGTYAESSEDKRVMVQADLSKGQTGSFFIYSEGIDNDKDGSFNEDGPGGVNFNRNLTFNYEEFGTNAGLHPVSEPESKAVIDFLFDHFNIYATFAFGPQDNLNPQQRPNDRQGALPSPDQAQTPAQEQSRVRVQGQFPPQGQRRMMGQNRKITSVQKSDEIILKLVADKYREITATRGTPAVKTAPGNFMEWSYYHYGRYSFSTPAWWIPVERDKNAEVTFLKYAEENKIDDVFVPWTEIKHPDFPGKKTEVGGIKPFSMINPPADKLEDLIAKNYKFIVAVAGMHPELEFLDAEIENKGDNVFRISLKVHNKGIFATCSEAGMNNMWTRLMRISVETADGQKFLSGQKVQRIERLEGDGSAEFSWLIMGKGAVRITAGAINTGTINTILELK